MQRWELSKQRDDLTSIAHPAEVTLCERHVFALSVRVVVQDVFVIQQQQFGAIFAVALLTAPPEATMRLASACRDDRK